MRPEGFLADLEAKPGALRHLAERLDDGLVDDLVAALPTDRLRRVVCAGMGSSRFAARGVMGQLRAAGWDAVTEYASAVQRAPGGPDTLVIGISATGGSRETIDALRDRVPGTVRLAVTNADGPLRDAADHVLELHAGEEVGGVACRTFQHTLLLLGVLADHLRGLEQASARAAARCRRVADATEHLLQTRTEWLDPVAAVLGEAPSTFLLAPVERLSSAEQGALMLREGPRRQADACETGDWSHVDVYLAKPLDYRALVFVGSRYEPEALDWFRQRGSRWVAVGGELEGAAASVRYPGDDDLEVARATEVLVPELLAAWWWAASG
ncbi:MAG: SIS domain-containing protein [Nitriliruptoraceae bacterium]|nr:SIS domain-containing protein [Nitriliruptoraceae bacterium]